MNMRYPGEIPAKEQHDDKSDQKRTLNPLSPIDHHEV